MTSFKIFIHGQKPEKNIPASIRTSCHYSFRFAKFFHQNKLLPLSSASPKKLSPLGAHLFCEMLSWMCLYSVFSQKKWKEKVSGALSVKNHEPLWVLSDKERRKNRSASLLKCSRCNIWAALFTGFSQCLSTHLHIIYISSYSHAIWLDIITIALAFTSQRGAQLENILMSLHEKKKQNWKTTTTNPKVCSLKRFSSEAGT